MCGHDYFDELRAIGLSQTTAGPLAEGVWRRIGRDVLAHLDKLHEGFRPYERPIWAEQQFGPPSGRRRPR